MISVVRLTGCAGLLQLSFLISGCTGIQHGEVKVGERSMKVASRVENSWNTGAKVTVNRVYTDAWEFHELSEGTSTVVRLYRSDFLVETLDGGSRHEIVFQLPSTAQPGDVFKLKPVSAKRPWRKAGEFDKLGMMRDGELTAFQYGNPMMGWMERPRTASVKIVSVDKNHAVIHLRLKAKLEPDLDFDMDEEFTLEVKPPEKRGKPGR